MKNNDSITLENTPEFIQLRDINDKIFKENFSVELDKLLESFYISKFKKVIEKVEIFECDVEDIKGNVEITNASLVRLKEVMSEEHIDIKEKFDEISSEIKSLELDKLLESFYISKFKEVIEKVDNIEYDVGDINEKFYKVSSEIKSLNNKSVNELRDTIENKILETNKKNNLKLNQLFEKLEKNNLQVEKNEKQVQNSISKIDDTDKKVTELVTVSFKELKQENNIRIKELIDLAESNYSSVDGYINNLSKEIKRINEQSNENLTLTEEKYELINQKINGIESNIKSNFDLIQQEDGLTQLTNYKKENNLQISSLKSAIVWLMGINIVLAISILTVLIIVVF